MELAEGRASFPGDVWDCGHSVISRLLFFFYAAPVNSSSNYSVLSKNYDSFKITFLDQANTGFKMIKSFSIAKSIA